MFEVRPCADQDEYGRAIGAIGQYFNPPPDEERLRPVALPADPAFDEARVALEANVARLNEIVFGPQDYALVARR